MNIYQAGKRGNRRLIRQFFERLATISKHGIFHGIVTHAPLKTRANTGFQRLIDNRVGVTGTGGQ